MPPPIIVYKVPLINIEMELAGVGAGWTNVMGDVDSRLPITFGYGIQGSSPKDRVAGPGSLVFGMNNAVNNSGGLLGYYSLNHTNTRAGFSLGIRVRLLISTTSALTRVKFLGMLDKTDTVVGIHGQLLVRCTVLDWMEEASKFDLTGLPTQVNKRSDQVFSAVLAAIPIQPQSTSIGTGLDIFPYALDNGGGGSSALTEFQRITQSELSYILMRGNSVNGGELVYVPRHGLTDAVSMSITDAALDVVQMDDAHVTDGRGEVLNQVKVTIHPRRIDTSIVTLFALQQPLAIGAGQTTVLTGKYIDPAQKAAKVGGTGMIVPVMGVDYAFATGAYGGLDISAVLTVVAAFGSDSVTYTLTNTGGDTGYVTILQARGYGLYDFEPVQITVDDLPSQVNGINPVALDMPYQSSLVLGDGLARYLLNRHSTQVTRLDTITMFVSRSIGMLAALHLEPGSLLEITETVSGLTLARFHIMGERGSIDTPASITMIFDVIAADNSAGLWRLDEPGASELGATTAAGFA